MSVVVNTQCLPYSIITFNVGLMNLLEKGCMCIYTQSCNIVTFFVLLSWQLVDVTSLAFCVLGLQQLLAI